MLSISRVYNHKYRFLQTVLIHANNFVVELYSELD